MKPSGDHASRGLISHVKMLKCKDLVTDPRPHCGTEATQWTKIQAQPKVLDSIPKPYISLYMLARYFDYFGMCYRNAGKNYKDEV